MSKKIKIVLAVAGGIIVAVFAAFMIYFMNYYHSVGSLDDYIAEYGEEVAISDCSDYYYMESKVEKADTLLVFYPGAKVEPLSYVPVMAGLSGFGIDCVIEKMPFNFAIFDKDRATKTYEMYKDRYSNFYIGGHSLGAATAAMYVDDNSDIYSGLIMLAGYSTADLTDNDIQVLSLVGENDGVINWDKMEEYKSNLPVSAITVRLSGGNHGQFGDYGFQAGDNEAEVDTKMQWEWTDNWINNLVFMGDK